MIIQRLQLKVTKSLFRLIPSKNYILILLECLEEALKYVLLLNFDEEPKYQYLIDEFKKAYTFIINEQGGTASPYNFRKPIFDWTVPTLFKPHRCL